MQLHAFEKTNERATMDHALCGLRVDGSPGLEQKATNVKVTITRGVDQGGVVADTTNVSRVRIKRKGARQNTNPLFLASMEAFASSKRRQMSR
jgi:hypothetical protein